MQDGTCDMDEIDEEFEHHLAARADELARRGMDPAEARAEAERRFGSLARHRQRCLAQRPEAFMKRTRSVLVILILAVLAVVAVDGWRRAVHAQRLASEMMVLRSQAADQSQRSMDALRQQQAAASANPPWKSARVVYVDGGVARPGVYQLPEGGRLTVSRLVAAAGGSGPGPRAAPYRVMRYEHDSQGQLKLCEYQVSPSEAESFLMTSDDHLIVASRSDAVE